MKITKKDFYDSWNRNIKSYSEDCSYPFYGLKNNDVWRKISKEYENITKAGNNSSYNAAIAQSDVNDEYSYEVGYFKAFKLIAYFSKEDSDSIVMPAVFVARHFIELTLKNLIFYLHIVFGDTIRKENTHNLKTLYCHLRAITLKHDLKPLNEERFSKFISQMAGISPKSDEYRYSTKQNGVWNFQNTDDPHLINLMALNHNINYFYSVTQSLLMLISDSSDSLLEDSVYNCSCTIELIRLFINNSSSGKVPKNKIKDTIIGLIDSYKLQFEKDALTFEEHNSKVEVNYNGVNLFIFASQGENEYCLQTKGLVL